MCSATIASLLGILVQSYECSENKDILVQMSNLDLVPPSPRQSPSRSNSCNKQNQGSYSPRLPAKQNTFKSSFLSLFERKSSPEESNSGTSFYVDLGKSESVPSNVRTQGKDIKTVQGTNADEKGDNQTGILVQLGLDPNEPVKDNSNVLKPVYNTGIMVHFLYYLLFNECIYQLLNEY